MLEQESPLSTVTSDLAEQLARVVVWRHGEQRAPHKPLLLLLALARVQRGEPRLATFASIEEKLRRLLDEFGPPRRAQHPEQPFWRLRKDGSFWEIPDAAAFLAEGGEGAEGNPRLALLRRLDVRGGFSPEVYALLRQDPNLVNRLAAQLLGEHFPESLHEAILDAVGMPWVPVVHRRDPEFRNAVLRIYEHRCAVCGFDARLGFADLALEAAHVQWHSHGGPDTEDNGLALCVLHHLLLDRGAIGIDAAYRVLVSQHLHGGESLVDSVLRHAGQPLRGPQPGTPHVASAYLAWHRREVFREPARQVQ